MTTWRVHCGEFFHFMDLHDEWTVDGFATLEAAQDYVRRFIRAEIESARKPGDTPAQTSTSG